MNTRLCLIGENRGLPVEGTRNIFEGIQTALPSEVPRLCISASAAGLLSSLRAVRAFRPDVLVYLTGPTSQSLAALALLHGLTNRAPRIVLGAHPGVKWNSLSGRGFRPERLLALSGSARSEALANGVRSSLFFLGVDRSRFRAAAGKSKAQVRRELNLPEDGHIVLHIGHWKPTRNLTLLAKAAEQGHRVVLIASPRLVPRPDMLAYLEESGVQVLCHFVRSIERYYQAADVYLCPVNNPTGIIEQPLSVLEALAAGLPVVAFPLSGIPDLASRYGGIRLVSTDNEALLALHESRLGGLPTASRKPPDWRDVANDLLSNAAEVRERKR